MYRIPGILDAGALKMLLSVVLAEVPKNTEGDNYLFSKFGGTKCEITPTRCSPSVQNTGYSINSSIRT